MSKNKKTTDQIQHEAEIREYAKQHNITLAAAAQRIYKAKMAPKWAEEAKNATPVLPAKDQVGAHAKPDSGPQYSE